MRPWRPVFITHTFAIFGRTRSEVDGTCQHLAEKASSVALSASLSSRHPARSPTFSFHRVPISSSRNFYCNLKVPFSTNNCSVLHASYIHPQQLDSAQPIFPMLDTNPTQLQHAPAASRSATPLFLLHDGGGTIFNYFMLGDLDRDVYGIHDTKFDTDEGWQGGLTEMASLYVSLIRSVRRTGPILLGG